MDKRKRLLGFLTELDATMDKYEIELCYDVRCFGKVDLVLCSPPEFGAIGLIPPMEEYDEFDIKEKIKELQRG